MKFHGTADYYGVVYFEDTTLSAKDVANVLHTMASKYPDAAFEGLEFGSTEWL